MACPAMENRLAKRPCRSLCQSHSHGPRAYMINEPWKANGQVFSFFPAKHHQSGMRGQRAPQWSRGVMGAPRMRNAGGKVVGYEGDLTAPCRTSRRMLSGHYQGVKQILR